MIRQLGITCCIFIICACHPSMAQESIERSFEQIGPLGIKKPLAGEGEIKPGIKGYPIPLVDLNDRSDLHVIVDKEDEEYLGHPTTVLLDDGQTMIAVYPKGHGRGAIVMKRSADGGLTWSERLQTPSSWETSLEVPTIYQMEDPRGKKRLIIFSGLYPARRALSEDGGQSWSELEKMGNWGGVVVMSDLIRLKDGSYMALFHDDGRYIQNKLVRTGIRTIYKTLSHDGGLTWSIPEGIITRQDVGPCEPGLIRSPDGKQIAMLIRENLRVKNSLLIVSNDEGKTWSLPAELPSTLTGDRHQAVYAPDGRLVISFRDQTPRSQPDSPTEGDWVAWVGTYQDVVQGQPGQYRIRFKDNTKGHDCAYPALELLPDGTIIATTYGHWEKGQAPYILSVRFSLEMTDHMQKESKRKP